MLTIKLNYEEFHVILRSLDQVRGFATLGSLGLRLMAACSAGGCRSWVMTRSTPLRQLPISEMAAETEFQLDMKAWNTIAECLEEALSRRQLSAVEDCIAYRVLVRVSDEGVFQGMTSAA